MRSAALHLCYLQWLSLAKFTHCSLSNSNYFMSAKKCRRESCIIDFMLGKMEFAMAIFKKLHFLKYSIKRCCKQITSFQKLV